MTRKQALVELIAKVEAGDQPQTKDFRAALEVPTQDMRYTQMPNDARAAYGGSLDAALALHEAVLPGWVYGYDGSIAWVKLHTSYRHDELGGYTARAWLIAILKALHAQAADE